MKLRKTYLFALIMTLIIGFQSCNNSDDESTGAHIMLKLIDAPGDYEKVNVIIEDVQYNNSEDEEGWRSFESFSGPVTVDLTELIADNSLLLTDQLIPTGMLKQIRLVLGEGNNLTIETENGFDENIPLNTPSAQQSGLKLNLDTELESGFSYTFILDWDVQKSVVKNGNSGMYNLKPVIRVRAEANSGSVMGSITGELSDDEVVGAVVLEGVSIEIYSASDAYVAETSTNNNGKFLFQGLDAGDYKLKIDEDGFDIKEITVTVTIGTVEDAGTIELTPTI